MATADIHYTVFWEAEKINSACNTWSITTDINVKLPNIQSYDPVEQFRTILDNEVFFFLAYFFREMTVMADQVVKASSGRAADTKSYITGGIKIALLM